MQVSQVACICNLLLSGRHSPVPAPLGTRSPALHTRLQRAVTVAAGVVVQVHDARVTLLPFVHPGVAAHLVAALLEALLSLTFYGLVDGLFTAV